MRTAIRRPAQEAERVDRDDLGRVPPAGIDAALPERVARAIEDLGIDPEKVNPLMA